MRMELHHITGGDLLINNSLRRLSGEKGLKKYESQGG